jgi:purine-binding chemotaxis protein CheW
MENQLVVFNLANEDYGVDIAAVNSIVEMQPITVVPHAPSFVQGVTNLRGEVLPVIDLRNRFGLPLGETTKDSRIVVVEVDGVRVGMVVDAVTEVLTVAEEAVEPPSPIVTTVDSARSMSGFITGIAKVGGNGNEQEHEQGRGREVPSGRLIILLDLIKVLSNEERIDLRATSRPQSELAPVAA